MSLIIKAINSFWGKPLKAEINKAGRLEIGGRIYEVKAGKGRLTEDQKTKILSALNAPKFDLKKEITQKISKNGERIRIDPNKILQGLEEVPTEKLSPKSSPRVNSSIIDPLVPEPELLDDAGTNLTNVDIIAVCNSPETYSHKQVKERVELVRDNALKFLYHSAEPYLEQAKDDPKTLAKLVEILQEQHESIQNECDNLIKHLPEDKDVSAGELKDLLKGKKFLFIRYKKGLESKVVSLLHKAQVKMGKEFKKDASPMTAFLNLVKQARNREGLLPTEKARLDAKTNNRVARMGNGDTFIAPTTDKDTLKEQFKLFAAQEMSAMTKREKTTKKITLEGTKYSSELVPLNGHFSKHFEAIVGHDGGISSAEVHNPHLKNGIESSLRKSDGTLISRTIRHGILGREGEKTQAKELVEAAVIQELSDLGDKRQAGQPLKITLTSVSLVSPGSDRVESLIKEEGKNEFELWNQQLDALRAAQGLKEVIIDGDKISVEISVVPFNFGVNKMAANVVGYGNAEQFKQNKESREAILNLTEDFVGAAKGIESLDQAKHNEFIKEIGNLGEDIDALLLDSTAYTKGKDQYECAAKIICLMNACDRYRQTLIKQGVHQNLLPPSFKSAINCMSGKDRTGVLDASVKAHEILREKHGHYLSHKELAENRDKRLEYTETLLILLAEGGGLEVTKWNTGVEGYKIDDLFLPWYSTSDVILEKTIIFSGWSDGSKIIKEAMKNLRKKGYYDIKKALKGLGKTTGA